MKLIDADKIINSLGSSDVDLYISGLIDEQPTAFDLDKVVEQLESIKEKKYTACSDQECGCCRYFVTCSCGDKADKLALDMAVEIVKVGGIK